MTMDAVSQYYLTLCGATCPSRIHRVVDGTGTWYWIAFDSTNWDDPVRVALIARDDGERSDPTTAVIEFSQFSDAEYDACGVGNTVGCTTAVTQDDTFVFPNLRSGPVAGWPSPWSTTRRPARSTSRAAPAPW